MIQFTKPHIGRKIGANLIDYGLTFIIFMIYTIKFGRYEPSTNEYSIYGFGALPLLIYWFIYHVLIEYLTGKTLGHYISGLKVENETGGKTSLIQNLKRHFLDFIDILPWGIPAIITILNTDKNQRLGDLFAKTIVVRNNERASRNFYKRPIEEQEWLKKNTWCDKCQKADLGIEDASEYLQSGKIYLSGFCNSCGKEIESEIIEKNITD